MFHILPPLPTHLNIIDIPNVDIVILLRLDSLCYPMPACFLFFGHLLFVLLLILLIGFLLLHYGTNPFFIFSSIAPLIMLNFGVLIVYVTLGYVHIIVINSNLNPPLVFLWATQLLKVLIIVLFPLPTKFMFHVMYVSLKMNSHTINFISMLLN